SVDMELVAAVRTIRHGGTVFSPSVSRLLARSSESTENIALIRFFEVLTKREREVFYLLAEGKTPREAAEALFLSAKTVHTHRQHIMRKLGLRTTTELMRYAIQQRLIKSV